MARIEPIRREFRVHEPCTVASLVGPSAARRVYLLQRGGGAFVSVADTQFVLPGDLLRVWLVDYGRLPELQKANAGYNDTWYAHDDRRDARAPWDDEQAAFDAWLPRRGARILEICCGAGRATPALIRDGNTVVGLDLAASSLRAAPPGPRYVRGDATALPFPDRSFDAALCLENSLGEFLVDPLAPLVELVRVCRDGGSVVIALREGADPGVWWSEQGHVLVIRAFPPARRTAFLQAAQRLDRVAAIRLRPGSERPWGGRAFHARLEIGPPLRRPIAAE